MTVAIRYFTKSKKGNTAKLASAIAEALALEPFTVESDLEGETDILFLVNAMYAASIDEEVKRFLERNASKIKCLVNVNSSASGASTLKVVSKACKALNISVSDKEYHTVGSWIFLNKGRPNEEDLNRLKDFVKEVAKGN